MLAVFLTLAGGCSHANPQPPVPLHVQQRLAKLYPGMAYVPDRLPTGYSYQRWDHDVGLYDIVFVQKGSSGEVLRGITFSVDPTPYVAPGLEGANPNEAYQINRHTEYWVGSAHYDSSAWRWVWSHGQSVRITAANVTARTDAQVIAYVMRVKVSAS